MPAKNNYPALSQKGEMCFEGVFFSLLSIPTILSIFQLYSPLYIKPRNTKFSLDGICERKITIMLKIKKFSKPFKKGEVSRSKRHLQCTKKGRKLALDVELA